ncbi:MAG TPA: Error-prone repair protein ImuA [Patescibacteria group bacterium]|nr:Error-prone repair protein ImuA [Patescibacteria group bacterium]
MESQSTEKSKVFEELRQQIQRLEGFKPEAADPVSLDLEVIDAALPGRSLPRAATHEIYSDSPEENAAAAGFTSALLARLAGEKGMIAWISKSRSLYPPGLRAYGLDPARILFVETPRDKDALWALEEILRCKSVSAVAAEITDADLTATRRLQLAAEGSGCTGFLLRSGLRRAGNSACVTRWRIAPLPGVATDDLPGLGSPAWQVELLRAKGGRPGSWPVMWHEARFQPIAPAHDETRDVPLPVAATVLPLRRRTG